MKRARSLTLLFAAIATAALTDCHAPLLNQRTTGEVAGQNVALAKAAIQTANSAWSKAIAAKDADKCASVYVDDALFFVPNEPVAVGKDAIRARVETSPLDSKLANYSFIRTN